MQMCEENIVFHFIVASVLQEAKILLDSLLTLELFYENS